MSLTPAIIWTVTALTLGVIGGVVLLWAICWDRARGRLRCPKCWYDMKGAVEGGPVPGEEGETRVSREPPWTCPECGKRTTKFRRLNRTRRRQRIAIAAAIVVVLATYTMLARDRILERGWIGAIPTTALVFIAPVDSSQWEWQEPFSIDEVSELIGPKPNRSFLLRELFARLDDRRMWRAHWQVFFSRLYSTTPAAKAELCVTRASWPRDVPIYLRGTVPYIFNIAHQDMRIRATRRIDGRRVGIGFNEDVPGLYEGTLGPADAAFDVEVEIQVAMRKPSLNSATHSPSSRPNPSSYRTIWRGVARTITIDERSVAEIMRSVDDPSDGSDIATVLRPVLLLDSNGDVSLGMNEVYRHLGGPNDCALGFRIEVLRDGELVATGEHLAQNMHIQSGGSMPSWGGWVRCQLHWIQHRPASQADLDAADWTLRAIGDPIVSLRDFNRDRYWPGVVEMPLRRLERSEDEVWDDE